MKTFGTRRTWHLPFLFFSLLSLPFFSTALGQNLEMGKKLFEGKCARCHGKEAAGNPKMARLLKVPLAKIDLRREEISSMSIYEVEALVDSGKHRMPTYRGKLTDTQIHEIARYLKFLVGNESQKEDEPAK